MAPRVSHIFCFFLSSLLLLPLLSQATSSWNFGRLEKFGSFKHLEGSRKGDKREGIQKVKQYLERYGYLNSVSHPQHKYSSSYSSDDDFDEVLESSLKAFQRFYHLSPTGIMDSPTAELMSQPRCGLPDTNSVINPDYAFSPTDIKWPADQMHIHYIVYPEDHPEEPITRGFDAWAAVSNFTFQRVREDSFAKIRVHFQVRDKGTAPPLDGPGGVWAYAGPSLTNATIHFDGEECWADGSIPDCMDLQTAATHEIGHLLGLAHSQVLEANMFAYTSDGEVKPLAQDDIDGIRAKYST